MNQGFTILQKQELTQIVAEIVGSGFDQKIEPRFKTLESTLRKIEKHIIAIKQDIKHIVNHFDLRLIDHEKRIKKVENHLSFTTN